MTLPDLVNKREIITSPIYFFQAQQRTLEERVSLVTLSKEEEDKLATARAGNTIRDKVLGLFKITDLINTAIKWNDDVDHDIKEAKKDYLLAQYFNETEKNGNAVSSLIAFLGNPHGNTLFNKILRILDNTPPDEELANHLVSSLAYMINSDFASLFSAHKYALGQIENLTPQALSILSDFRNWPPIKLGSYNASGTRVTSDWLVEFSDAYCHSKGILNRGITDRVRHSANELIVGRLIEANLAQEGTAICRVTEIGMTIIPYISKGV